jgi:hypothetical protein
VNWSDERYVRLFTRDSVTWLSWRWETRCTLALLLRKVDRSGVLDTGRTDKAKALALTLMMPLEVVTVALEELLASGTAEVADGSIVLPNFIAAQEAVISDRQRQKDLRERRLAETRANERNNGDARHAVSHGVTDGHAVSRGVTPAVPSRAVPSVPSVPSQDEKKGETPSVPLPLELLPDTPKTKRAPKKPDPDAEFTRFLNACTEDEQRVFKAYRKAFDLPEALAPDWGLLKFVRGKLQAHHVEELEAAVAGAGREKWHREKSSSLRALLADASTVAQLAKKGAA